MRALSKFAAVLLSTATFGFVSYAQGQTVTVNNPTMSFTYEGEQMGGDPSLGTLNNQLFIAFRANDSSQTLFIDSSADGYTLQGAVDFPNIVLGSDPAIAGDNLNNILQVAFKSPNNDTLEVCAISYPLTASSTTVCSNFPDVHMLGAPHISAEEWQANPNGNNPNGNYGQFYVAYETSNGDPNGSNHLGLLLASNSARNGYGETYSRLVAPTLVGGPPSIIAEVVDGEAANFPDYPVQVAFQADDSSHRLFIQSFDPFLDNEFPTAPAVAFATQVGGTPQIAGGNHADGQFVTAFQADDGSNHLFFESFAFTDSRSVAQGPALQNAALTGGSPALIYWVPRTGSYAGQGVFSAGFLANDSNHHLFLGTQLTND